MKVLGFILVGIGWFWTFVAFLLFVLEEYSYSQASILSILLGVAIGVVGVLCLSRSL